MLFIYLTRTFSHLTLGPAHSVGRRNKLPQAAVMAKHKGPLNCKLSTNAPPDAFTDKKKEATCVHCQQEQSHHRSPKHHPLAHSQRREPSSRTVKKGD